MRSYFTYIKNRSKTCAPFVFVLSAYALFCIASFIRFLVVGQTRNAVMSILFTLLVPVVFLLEKLLNMKFVTPFISAVLFIAAGSILGSCYNLYTTVPCFDAILHTVSGFAFACLGFALLELFIGEAKTAKQFWACLLFGFAFSLAIALLWELFEWMGTRFFGFDMQEDTIIYSFKSYLLSGTHNEAFDVDGIIKTVIYLSDGNTVTINGYLDTGLIDTIGDMTVCFVGAVVYVVAIAIDWFKRKVLFRHLVPAIVPRAIKEDIEYMYMPLDAACAET